MAENDMRTITLKKFVSMGVPAEQASSMIDDMLEKGIPIEAILNADVEAVSADNLFREELEEYIGKIMGQLNRAIENLGIISEKKNPTVLDAREKEKVRKDITLNLGCLAGIQSTLKIVSLILDDEKQRDVCLLESEKIRDVLNQLWGEE